MEILGGRITGVFFEYFAEPGITDSQLDVYKRQVIIQCQLILGDGETCGQQTFAVFQFVGNVQQPFLAGAGLADIQRNLGDVYKRQGVFLVYPRIFVPPGAFPYFDCAWYDLHSLVLDRG